MNDIILSSLINLFAAFGSENGLDKDNSIITIDEYLKYHFGLRNPQSYITLYDTLRDYYDDFPELDKAKIVDDICSNLKRSITVEEQKAMMLRLLEFCSNGSGSFDPEHPIFKSVAKSFEVPDGLYSDFTRFVKADEGGNVKISQQGFGVLKTLFLEESDTLFLTYLGNRNVMLNDIPVRSGVFRIWQKSGVLKCDSFNPMYYSTIMEMYGKNEKEGAVEFCGRGIDFRFDETSDVGMHNFSFTLHSGQLVAIMGGSGVGKSTLLSLLNGSLSPQKGSITINGHDISDPAAKALIGFVPQDDLLIEELTVYQNLWYTAKLCFDKMPDNELDAKVTSVLTVLGLDAAAHLKVGSPINKYISGGQRKRLNIALELIREPAILFLDEPTSGLSSTDTEKVINLLKELCGRGKLIITNIHQPSSTVFKLYDRLWLLDRGGYPVFDGNPIDAVSYFKTAAHYADSETSACPTCGTIDPDIPLKIIDERAFDASGHVTEKRKVQPAEWHQMYLDRRPEMETPEVVEVPPTDQKKPGKFKQLRIFLERNVFSKLTNLQYLCVTFLEAPLLAAICALLTHFTPDSGLYSVMENKNMPSYLFMAIIVAIFLGMSGSAEEIIRDRALLKREKFLNLSYGSYIWSKILYMGVVCLVQTFLFIIVGNLIMGIKGMLWTWWLVLFVSAFLSGLIGLLLSQCMNSVVSIYITIPLLLIPQILLCGLVVNFSDLNPDSKNGNVPLIGDVIPSRWAYEALAVASFSQNPYEKLFFEQDRDKYTNLFYREAFLYELESQIESRRDEMERDDRQENPVHLEVLRSELPYLAYICGIDEYSGDWSYESLISYTNQARSSLGQIANGTTLALDKEISAYIKDYGKDQLLNLKRSSYNLKLEDLVLNRNTDKMYSVRGNRIIPKCGYVFLTPRSKNGRAPFYSGVKVVGNYEIPTLWFNVFVLLMMSLALTICLITDFPGRYLRKERN